MVPIKIRGQERRIHFSAIKCRPVNAPSSGTHFIDPSLCPEPDKVDMLLRGASLKLEKGHIQIHIPVEKKASETLFPKSPLVKNDSMHKQERNPPDPIDQNARDSKRRKRKPRGKKKKSLINQEGTHTYI